MTAALGGILFSMEKFSVPYRMEKFSVPYSVLALRRIHNIANEAGVTLE